MPPRALNEAIIDDAPAIVDDAPATVVETTYPVDNDLPDAATGFGGETSPMLLPLIALVCVIVVALVCWRLYKLSELKYYEELEAANAERERLEEEAAARLEQRRAQIEEERRRALQEVWNEKGLTAEAQKREMAKRDAADQARYQARNAAKERKAAQKAAEKAEAAALEAIRRSAIEGGMIEDGHGGWMYPKGDPRAAGGVPLACKGSVPGQGKMASIGQRMGISSLRSKQGQQARQQQQLLAMDPRLALIDAEQAAAEAEAEAAYRAELQAAAIEGAKAQERAAKLQVTTHTHTHSQYTAHTAHGHGHGHGHGTRHGIATLRSLSTLSHTDCALMHARECALTMCVRCCRVQAKVAAQRLIEYREKREAEDAANVMLDEQVSEEMMRFREIKAPVPKIFDSPPKPAVSQAAVGGGGGGGGSSTTIFQPAINPQRTGAPLRQAWLPSAGWKSKEAIRAETEQVHTSPRPTSSPPKGPIAKHENATEWVKSWRQTWHLSNRGSSPRSKMLVPTTPKAGAEPSPNKYRELINKYSC